MCADLSVSYLACSVYTRFKGVCFVYILGHNDYDTTRIWCDLQTLLRDSSSLWSRTAAGGSSPQLRCGSKSFGILQWSLRLCHQACSEGNCRAARHLKLDNTPRVCKVMYCRCDRVRHGYRVAIAETPCKRAKRVSSSEDLVPVSLAPAERCTRRRSSSSDPVQPASIICTICSSLI